MLPDPAPVPSVGAEDSEDEVLLALVPLPVADAVPLSVADDVEAESDALVVSLALAELVSVVDAESEAVVVSDVVVDSESVVDAESVAVLDDVSVVDDESVAEPESVVDDESVAEPESVVVELPVSVLDRESELEVVLPVVPSGVKTSVHCRVSWTRFCPLTTIGVKVTVQSSVTVPPGTGSTL